MVWGALQLYVATLGAELFLARTSLVISIIGAVILLGGTEYLRVFAFPLFLLFFMVPIPAVIYNQLTFPLQLIASRSRKTRIVIAADSGDPRRQRPRICRAEAERGGSLQRYSFPADTYFSVAGVWIFFREADLGPRGSVFFHHSHRDHGQRRAAWR